MRGVLTSRELAERREEARADAFRQLADAHLTAAYRLAMAILDEPADAQDATHDAFELAWRKWGTLRDPSKFAPWFDRILINTCRDWLRSAGRRRMIGISDDLPVAAREPFGAIHDRDVLGESLQRLSPDHRLVVALRFYRDLTVDDIAFRLGVPSGTVKSRLHHALRELQSLLDEAEAEGVRS
jgi:RNA polymerase sigma-70 factor (ECF subfamily)